VAEVISDPVTISRRKRTHMLPCLGTGSQKPKGRWIAFRVQTLVCRFGWQEQA
jgi:hypothetical protein